MKENRRRLERYRYIYATCNKQHIYMYISVYVNELYYELCIVTMRLTKITIFATIRTRKAGMIKNKHV